MNGGYRDQSRTADAIVAAWGRIGSAWGKHAERNAAIALGLLTAFWLLDLHVPTFNQIAPFDNTAYIRSGYRLAADGVLGMISWGPLVAVLHALVYVIVQESPNWFVWTAVGGRLCIYALVCTGVYQCTRSLSPAPARHAALVIGLTWPVAASFFAVWNQSDYLFVAMSALALSRLLAYLSDRSTRHLVWGSTIVGMAALTRPDGLVLLVSFAALSFATCAKDAGAFLPRGAWKLLGAAVAPATLIVAGYLVLYGTVTGTWETGVMSRTYQAFEHGHGVVFREQYPTGNTGIEGTGDFRELFGTRADNRGSVFRAIVGNPGAFLERLVHSVVQLPEQVAVAYGGPLTVAFLFLASRGALSLWRARQRWTLVVLLGWHLHLTSYFLTFWSFRYVRFTFVALTLLAGLGASAMASNWRDWRERTTVAVVIGGLVAWLLWDGEGRMWADPGAGTAGVTLVLLAAMALFVPTLTPRFQRRRDGKLLRLLAGLSMVSVVAVAAGRSPADHLPLRAGVSAQERAVAAAAAVLPPGTPIASFGFKLQAAARRPHRMLGDELMVKTVSASALEEWQARSDAGAIYLDPFMRKRYGSWFSYLRDRLESDPQWVPVFSEAASHTWLFSHRSLLQARGVWRTNEPVVRSDFDVFILDQYLVFTKEGCNADDMERPFFVHAVPVDRMQLPEWARKRGILHLDFDFDKYGYRIDGRCVAIRRLPAYELDNVRMGQYIPGERRFWQGRIDVGGG